MGLSTYVTRSLVYRGASHEKQESLPGPATLMPSDGDPGFVRTSHSFDVANHIYREIEHARGEEPPLSFNIYARLRDFFSARIFLATEVGLLHGCGRM